MITRPDPKALQYLEADLDLDCEIVVENPHDHDGLTFTRARGSESMSTLTRPIFQALHLPDAPMWSTFAEQTGCPCQDLAYTGRGSCIAHHPSLRNLNEELR
ncbi:MAG TPA: hypothetical protein VJQ57_13990 [Acidimicrobiia bacterium]|nr:hypothetical protein [Acidimicrobiia bacterium]